MMPGVATIDRRVEVIDGSDDQRASIRRVSELRPLPFVVLLGEPGIGKSTVLGIEAAREGAPVFKVRKLMTGAQPELDVTLWLDALDEYRTGGNHLTRFMGSPTPSRPPRSHAGASRVDPRIGVKAPTLLPFGIRPRARKSLSRSSCHWIVQKPPPSWPPSGKMRPTRF